MNMLQKQVHKIAWDDPRYPSLQEQLRTPIVSPVTESYIWLLWVEIYFDAMLSLYTSCKKEGLETSCEELKKMFKDQISFDETLLKNPSLMSKYKNLLS